MLLSLCTALNIQAQGVRSESLLREWEFRNDHDTAALQGWEKVTVPHDWAIAGPFDRANDLQTCLLYTSPEPTRPY